MGSCIKPLKMITTMLDLVLTLSIFLIITRAINVANAKPTINSWEEKDSSFCQLDLFKDNTMKSMPFASFSQDAKRIRITRNKPKSFRITSTPDTKCCWQIKKKGKLLKTLNNDEKSSLFSRLEGIRPPFIVKSCLKKI